MRSPGPTGMTFEASRVVPVFLLDRSLIIVYLHREKVTKPGEVEGALKRALDSGKTAVIGFAIDRESYAPVVYYEPFVGRQV